MSNLNTKQRAALKDGDFGDPTGRKFPILDQDDVDSAAHLIGKAGNPEAVKARIIAIAKRKGLAIPDAWQESTQADDGSDDAMGMAEPGADESDSEDDPDAAGADDDEDHPDTEANQADDPSVSDVHAGGVLGARSKPSNAWTRLLGTLRGKAKANGGNVSAQEIEDAMRHARGYAGGKARGRVAAEMNDMGDTSGTDTMCSECARGMSDNCSCVNCSDNLGDDRCLCAGARKRALQGSDPLASDNGEPFRLFMEYEFAEPPNGWIPCLPTPGTFKHPKYGEINISKARNADFVSKFNSGIYQSQVPLDAEHEGKLSGAMGWIKKLRLNEDGSADAHVDWTPRGSELVDAGAYKFISPEWYDEWQDPASGKVIKNVLIGAALTTRPFFKESALRPLVASEKGGLYSPETYTEEESMEFTELQGKIATLEAQNTAIVAENKTFREMADNNLAIAKTAAEEVAKIRAEQKQAALVQTAKGFIGETARHITIMQALEGDSLKAYTEQQTALAEQLADSDLFRAVGVGGSEEGNASADAKAKGIAQKYREQNPKLTMAQAIAKAYTENPSLYDAAERERKARLPVGV